MTQQFCLNFSPERSLKSPLSEILLLVYCDSTPLLAVAAAAAAALACSGLGGGGELQPELAPAACPACQVCELASPAGASWSLAGARRKGCFQALAEFGHQQE